MENTNFYPTSTNNTLNKQIPKKIKKFLIWEIFVLTLILSIASYPIWQAGFFGDDAYNSWLHGKLLISNQTPVSYICTEIKGWSLKVGRLCPLALIVTMLPWLVFYKLVVYRIYHWITLILSLLFCSALIWKISKQTRAAILFLGILPLFWSITSYASSLTSYAPLLPVTTIFITGAIYLFINYTKTNKNSYLFGSALLYACALLTYEISILLLVTLTFLAPHYYKNIKKTIVVLIPFALTTLAYVLVCYFLRRLGNPNIYDGVAFGEPSLFWITYLKQFVSAIPLSHFLFDPDHVFKLNSLLFNAYKNPTLLTLCIFLFFSTVTFIYHLTDFRIDKNNLYPLLCIGLTFQFIPPVFMAISYKYQHNLMFGNGYIPVYVQYIGLAFIFIALVMYIRPHLKSNYWHSFRMALSLLVSSGIVLAFLVNHLVVAQINQVVKYPRNLFENAVNQKLLQGLPPSSVVMKDNLNIWDTAGFIAQTSGIKIKISDIHDKNIPFENINKSGSKNLYFLEYATITPNTESGYVILSQIDSISQKSNNTQSNLVYKLHAPKIYCQVDSYTEAQTIIARLSNKYNIPTNYLADFSTNCITKKPFYLPEFNYTFNKLNKS